jgi:uncharacterized protein (DUF697 family)/GTPase SAR1 family protein
VAFEAEDWFKGQFHRHYAEESQKVGRFNLAIFGKTGVGKSTLVNSIFGDDVAKTGIGKPVTQDAHLHLHESGKLGVLDTRGLEIGQDNDTIIGELQQYVAEMRQQPLKDQVHVAWYCVRSSDRRFENTEAEFIKRLDALGLPVMLVLTQVPMNGDTYHPDVVRLAEEIEAHRLPVFESKVFMSMALADDFAGHPSHGLHDLLDATFRAAPDGAQEALLIAQKIDLKRKRDKAKIVIGSAMTAAGAAGLTPIPFSDAVILVPIQLGMMAGVAVVFDIDMDKATMVALAATAGATTAGRSLATNLLKFIPGVGTVVGGSITGAIAAGFTAAMGAAWTAVCVQLAEGKLSSFEGPMDNAAIRELFLDELKREIAKLNLRFK